MNLFMKSTCKLICDYPLSRKEIFGGPVQAWIIKKFDYI